MKSDFDKLPATRNLSSSEALNMFNKLMNFIIVKMSTKKYPFKALRNLKSMQILQS